jgi:hypothetical protein
LPVAKLVARLVPGKLVVWSNAVAAPVSLLLDGERLVEFLVEHEEVPHDEAFAVVGSANRDCASNPSQPVSEVFASSSWA